MKDAGDFNVTLLGDRDIELTRSFEAPRTIVFDAWTNPDHVRHWWDPTGVPLSFCEIDLRPGGSFRWVNNAHAGWHIFAGTYREITPPERLVFTVKILPSSPDSLTTLIFREEGSQTKLTLTIECASIADRDALLRMRVHEGTRRTLDNLATYLEGMKLPPGAPR